MCLDILSFFIQCDSINLEFDPLGDERSGNWCPSEGAATPSPDPAYSHHRGTGSV